MARRRSEGEIEQSNTELVDELARVIWDGEDAKTIVRRAGFPSQHVPEFKRPLAFWTAVVQAAADGQVPGGVQAIADEAAKQYPENEVFGSHRGKPVERGIVQEPFVGLRAIDEEHRDLFFGREEETAALVEKLRRTPLAMVVGDSGSGKSSLVLAGLVPRFREGALIEDGERSAGEHRHVIKMSPRGAPLRQLGEGVYEAGEALGLPDEQRRTFAKWASSGDADDVRLALRCNLPRERTQVLLVVDQLEELWTSSPREERTAFVDLLLELVTTGEGWLYVVLTMRRDYANLCNELAPLKAWLEREDRRARYDLRRISETGLRRVVTEPLRLAGVGQQQREALVEVVLGDVGERPGDLALVQMALSETWSARKDHGCDLVVAYHHVGRVEGALAKAADSVRDKMNGDARAHLDAIMVRLVQLGDTGGATRRLAANDEFEDDRWKVVQHLASKSGKRLVVLGGKEGSPIAEISHEALVTAWPYFQELLFELSKDKRVLDALVTKAKTWGAVDDAEGKLLAVGAELDAFERLSATHSSWLSRTESRFVEASSKAQQDVLRAERQRQQRLLTAAMTVSGVLLGLLVFAGWQYSTAVEARDVARQLAEDKVDLALQKDEEAQKARSATRGEQGARASMLARIPGRELDALELGVTAVGGMEGGGAPSARALQGLDEALSRAQGVVVLRGHKNSVIGLTWTGDGTRLATASVDGTTKLWKSGTGEPLATLSGHKTAVVDLAWTEDGTRLATASADGTARLWDGQTGTALANLQGHTKEVMALAWTPDDTRLATASQDGTARLWDGRTGDVLAILAGHAKPLVGLAWRIDGKHLATASEDGMAMLWDGETGKRVAKLEGHTAGVTALAWNADGTRLATASEDETARLWDGETGKGLASLEGHRAGLVGLAWTADGTRLATVSRDDTVKLWDGKTGERLVTLPGHVGAILGLAWTTDGARLATASSDETAMLWDGRTGEHLATLRGHTGDVVALAWTADGTRLATVSEDATARLWDGETGKPLVTLYGHTGEIVALEWKTDGTRLATASLDGTTRVWDGETRWRTIVRGDTARVAALEWTADGTRLATVSEYGTVTLWDARTGKTSTAELGRATEVVALAWRDDGTRLAIATKGGTVGLWGGEMEESLIMMEGHTKAVVELAWTADGTRLATASLDQTTRLWDGKTGDPLTAIPGHTGWTSALAWSTDGERLATASEDGEVKLWNGRTGAPLATLKGHMGTIRALAWSADGMRLVSASLGGAAKLWDGQTGESLATLRSPNGFMPVEWRGDGTRLATTSEDGSVRLWDGRTGNEVATLEGHTTEVTALAWTTDGTRLATAGRDGTARLWDGQTGEPLATLEGHTAGISTLAWTSDGTRLATAGYDNTARLWDGQTGEPLATLEGHTKAVVVLAWSVDATHLTTASTDGTARLWLVSTQGWLQSGCDILRRSTTAVMLDSETMKICAAVRATSSPSEPLAPR